MKKIFILLFAALNIFLFSSQPYADIIVDTGTPSTSGPAISGGSPYPVQWASAEFNIPSPGYSLTDVKGYLKNNYWEGRQLFIEIRTGQGEVPSNTTLYSGTFTIPAFTTGWVGINGMQGWELTPGDYWVVFGNSVPGTYVNVMWFAPNPLGDEAWYQNGTWWEDDGWDIGVKISGNPLSITPVPEPTLMVLLGISVLSLAGLKRWWKD